VSLLIFWLIKNVVPQCSIS